jgi:hypothetical protein
LDLTGFRPQQKGWKPYLLFCRLFSFFSFSSSSFSTYFSVGRSLAKARRDGAVVVAGDEPGQDLRSFELAVNVPLGGDGGDEYLGLADGDSFPCNTEVRQS